MLEVARAGYPAGIVDGYIVYVNGRWAGPPPARCPGAAPDYLRERAAEVAPLVERSGCESWTEFAVRSSHGVPQVRTTVGATSKRENVQAFLAAARARTPLPEDLQAELKALQRRWAAKHDAQAAPWSMERRGACRGCGAPGPASPAPRS